jgi:FkbM family methyltransferase
MALDNLARRDLPPLLAIQPYGWATFDGEQVFGAQGGSDYAVCVYSKTDDTITCQVRCPRTVMISLGHDRIDLLKMDIEGSEFGVIRQMLNENILPGQLLVEFHHRWDCFTLHDTRDLVAELQRVGYVIFFVSETGNEFSFLRHDLIGRAS